MSQKKLMLGDRYWLEARSSEPNGAFYELWQLLSKGVSGGQATQVVGHLSVYYDDRRTADSTVPHWVALLFFRKDLDLPEDLPRAIGDELLRNGLCGEPLLFTGYQYLPYVHGTPDQRCFSMEFGRVFMAD